MNARLAGSLRQREELVAGTHRQDRQRSLVGRDRHAEQFLVERDRALLIRDENREVIDLADRYQAIAGRRLGSVAELAQQAFATAVGVLLQLHHNAVRVGDVELRRAVGMPSEIRSAHPDADGARAGVRRLRDAGDAVLAQDADQPFVVEVVHRQAGVVDARLHVGTPAAKRDELRPGADAQDQRPRLAGGKGEAEQALVELEGPPDVGHGQRHVIPGVDRNGRGGGCSVRRLGRVRGGRLGLGLAAAAADQRGGGGGGDGSGKEVAPGQHHRIIATGAT